MPIKKSELYSSLWKSCDELRGGMDASQYKDYVLVLLGDAYEYLMRHFSTESGKSKGQFYTPSEVSRVLAKIIGINKDTKQSQSAYDPTGGSGSLVLKAFDEASHGLSIYLPEMDNATAALARMNMILHSNPTAEVWQGNTLADPHWLNPDGALKTYYQVKQDFALCLRTNN